VTVVNRTAASMTPLAAGAPARLAQMSGRVSSSQACNHHRPPVLTLTSAKSTHGGWLGSASLSQQMPGPLH
jgi:hypothetical protein